MHIVHCLGLSQKTLPLHQVLLLLVVEVKPFPSTQTSETQCRVILFQSDQWVKLLVGEIVQNKEASLVNSRMAYRNVFSYLAAVLQPCSKGLTPWNLLG